MLAQSRCQSFPCNRSTSRLSTNTFAAFGMSPQAGVAAKEASPPPDPNPTQPPPLLPPIPPNCCDKLTSHGGRHANQLYAVGVLREQQLGDQQLQGQASVGVTHHVKLIHHHTCQLPYNRHSKPFHTVMVSGSSVRGSGSDSWVVDILSQGHTPCEARPPPHMSAPL